MNAREKYLYHQIHPLKLATDCLSGLGSLSFFWQHDLVGGLIMLLAAPIAVSFLITRFLPLEHLKKSKFGRYYAQHLSTKYSDIARLLGMLLMVLGAWYHVGGIIVIGLVTVLFMWLRGLVVAK